jgi:DNA primase
VDACHPYLAKRGLTYETAAYFGVGFFSGKGSMSGRVVIPIHDTQGELVAYAGRAIGGAQPRYKLPANFQKSHVVFNLHRAQASKNPSVVVVEGFFDCLKVHQAGFNSVVALMGSSLSDTQAKLLEANFDRVVLMLDGDEAGRAACREIAPRLATRLWVRITAVPPARQPDQLSSCEIIRILGTL